MADITSATSTAAGAAAGAIVTVLPAAMLGAQIDALLLGLIGSFVAVAWFDELNSMLRAVAAVLAGALASGVFSGVLAIGAWWMLPEGLRVLIDPEMLRMPMALLTGFLGPSIWPLVKRRAERRLQGGDQ